MEPNQRNTKKDDLDHTARRKANNRIVTEETTNLYNTDVTERNNPEKGIRIFTKQKNTEEETIRKPIYRRHETTGKSWEVHIHRWLLHKREHPANKSWYRNIYIVQIMKI